MSNNEETDRQAIGRRLRETREYLVLSQDEVAKSLGLSRSAISLIESGERKVDAVELGRFSALYQQPMDYFISGEMVSTDQTPRDVAYLARAATKLTKDDRAELLRFAQYLQSKSKTA